METQVVELVVYPIKSLRGVSLDRSQVERRGLGFDRRWMLVDENGVFRTQRSDPRLALLDTALAEEGILVNAAGRKTLHVPLEPSGPECEVTVWKSVCRAQRVSQRADEWFSEVLGVPTSLVHMPESTERYAGAAESVAPELVGFADANPILLASMNSLHLLNSKLTDPIPIRRFRPNVVIEGAEPFAEDTWETIQVGDVRLRRTSRCARCLVTTIDIETGRTCDEPLRTLATFRSFKGHAWFGSYYSPDSLGPIAVGDGVEISIG